MTTGTRPKSPYPSAREGAASAQLHADSEQCKSASYRLAFQDPEFLLRDDLRSVRLQLELLKPEIILREQHIESTVVVFGSSRLVDPETAEARLVSAQTEYDKKRMIRCWLGNLPQRVMLLKTAAITAKLANWAI